MLGPMKSPRRLHFAVGNGLLTASLATSLATGAVGCDKKTSNPGPETPHVNEGPEPTEEPLPDTDAELEPGPASNPGPVDEPEGEIGAATNTGPVAEPADPE